MAVGGAIVFSGLLGGCGGAMGGFDVWFGGDAVGGFLAWLFVCSSNGRLYTIRGLCFCYRPASLPVFVVGFHLPLDLCLCGHLFLGGGGVSVCVGVRRVVLVWFGLRIRCRNALRTRAFSGGVKCGGGDVVWWWLVF